VTTNESLGKLNCSDENSSGLEIFDKEWENLKWKSKIFEIEL
jgi:hypothetical protein